MGKRINSGLASGVRGQVSIENYELISKLVAQAVPGDINLADPKYNYFHDYIERRKDKDSEGNFDFQRMVVLKVSRFMLMEKHMRSIGEQLQR